MNEMFLGICDSLMPGHVKRESWSCISGCLEPVRQWEDHFFIRYDDFIQGEEGRRRGREGQRSKAIVKIADYLGFNCQKFFDRILDRYDTDYRRCESRPIFLENNNNEDLPDKTLLSFVNHNTNNSHH